MKETSFTSDCWLFLGVVGYKWMVDEHEIEREDRRVEKEERRIIQRGIGWKVNCVCEMIT